MRCNNPCNILNKKQPTPEPLTAPGFLLHQIFVPISHSGGYLWDAKMKPCALILVSWLERINRWLV
jgi:hypothetical protein